MTWAPLLLADPSPCLRQLALRELFHRSATDVEVRELDAFRKSDALIADLLELQGADGSWDGSRGGVRGGADRVHSTSLVIARLGYLGFGRESAFVQKGAEFLFSQQRKDGAWPLPQVREHTEADRAYTMMPLQTALPLRGLAMCGYASDPRCENAYEWLLSQRLEDGAWPTGMAAGNYGYVAGYRKMPHSHWGCRSNTTGALASLILHPERRSAPETRRALDLLLGRQTRDRYALGFEMARLIGAEPARGFITFYARFDPAQILDFCWRVGATVEDERVAGIVDFVLEQQGPGGLWDYEAKPQASRWLTFDLLRSLSRLEETGDWLGMEPRTPFQTYPRKRRRY